MISQDFTRYSTNMTRSSNLDQPSVFLARSRSGSGNDYLKMLAMKSEQFPRDTAAKRPRLTDDEEQPQPFADQELKAVIDLCSKSEDIKEGDKLGQEATVLASQFNPLNQPSPLGLMLRKSPSLLDLIQRKIAQNVESHSLSSDDKCHGAVEKDKLKAANFPASSLRIGTWECTSRYDGDLVAKCYYAKRKLVWEILNSGLKSKMEIQWPDISALKADFPEDQSATLDIELSRPPLFFKEINPQPRKHTLWQSTSDFTDGQATISRHHHVHFPVGVLNRHFEKLLQCDMRLKVLSEQGHTFTASSFFDTQNLHVEQQQLMQSQLFFPSCTPLQPLSMDSFGYGLMPMQSSTSHAYIFGEGLQNKPSSLTGLPGKVVRNYNTGEGLDQKTLHSVMGVYDDTVTRMRPPQMQVNSAIQVLSNSSPSSVMDVKNREELSSNTGTEDRSKVKGLYHPVDVKTVACSLDLEAGSNWPWDAFVNIGRSHETARHSFHISEQEALNELSLQLLGEPMSRDYDHRVWKGVPSGQVGLESSQLLSKKRESCLISRPGKRALALKSSKLCPNGSTLLAYLKPLP